MPHFDEPTKPETFICKNCGSTKFKRTMVGEYEAFYVQEYDPEVGIKAGRMPALFENIMLFCLDCNLPYGQNKKDKVKDA